MKPKLTLSLATGQMVLEVVHAPAGRMRRLLDAVLPARKAHVPAGTQPALTRVALSGAMGAANLRPRLEQAMVQLKTRHHRAVTGLDLEVQLGLEHARIGLMVLEDVAATALTAGARETYAQAWAAQMLHLDAATQIVRWQILADPHKLLISCVDRGVFETLSAFAGQHGLRFASCRPAVLYAIAAQRDATAESEPTAGLTVLWTESGADAARSNSVQLLR